MEAPVDAEVPDRGLAASSALFESLTLASPCFHDWDRSGKLVLVRGHQSEEDKRFEPAAAGSNRKFSCGEAAHAQLVVALKMQRRHLLGTCMVRRSCNFLALRGI